MLRPLSLALTISLLAALPAAATSPGNRGERIADRRDERSGIAGRAQRKRQEADRPFVLPLRRVDVVEAEVLTIVDEDLGHDRIGGAFLAHIFGDANNRHA